MMVRTLITAAALIVASAGVTLAQDVDKGARVFKKCGICHKIGPGATNLVGPELNGLDGRKSGSVAGLHLFRRQQEFGHRLERSAHSRNTSRTQGPRSPAPK